MSTEALGELERLRCCHGFLGTRDTHLVTWVQEIDELRSSLSAARWQAWMWEDEQIEHEEGRWKTGEANQRRIEVQDRSKKQLAFAVVARYEIGSLMKVRFTHVLPILESDKFLTPHIRQTFTCGSIRHKQQDGHEVTLLHNCCYLPASVIQDAVREICLR